MELVGCHDAPVTVYPTKSCREEKGPSKWILRKKYPYLVVEYNGETSTCYSLKINLVQFKKSQCRKQWVVYVAALKVLPEDTASYFLTAG